MIEIAPGFRVAQLWFPTIQLAQASELATLFDGLKDQDGRSISKQCAEAVIEHLDQVVAILTDDPKPTAKRKPRSDIGTKRKAKGEAAREGEK
jgi:hypothetical protein